MFLPSPILPIFQTAAKLIDGVVGPDLQPSPDFVEVMLQSSTYDGYVRAKGDRPIVDAGKLW